MTTDNKIGGEKPQYGINREEAKRYILKHW